MNAMHYQMLGLFKNEAEPIARRYNLRLVIDWGNGNVNFITEKDTPNIELQCFYTEMTAVIQKYTIFRELRRV